MERVLVAIGGNALYDKSQGNNLHDPFVKTICAKLVEVVRAGYQPVITFGNGPQVGNLYDMAETSVRLFPEPVTLDTCVSWTQGEIGYRLARELQSQLSSAGFERTVVAVNTTAVVSPEDAAFQKPTKPVGRFISPEEAELLYNERGWIIGPDANRGYRRMVPSPRPLEILEADAIERMVAAGVIVLCCGGGGIPVAWTEAGRLRGIEAVIDKDYTSCLLAKTLQLENLVICTEVQNICLHFGTPQQTPLRQVTVAQAKQYLGEGHFPPGSMGPKVAAMIDYLEHGGRRAFITDLESLVAALQGQAGTEIHTL
jgi:carbamate kinase